jgi:uncharacterized protein YcnI
MQAATSQTAQFPIDVVVGPEFVTAVPEWKLEPHKISVKHDFDRHNDTTRQSERETKWSTCNK